MFYYIFFFVVHVCVRAANWRQWRIDRILKFSPRKYKIVSGLVDFQKCRVLGVIWKRLWLSISEYTPAMSVLPAARVYWREYNFVGIPIDYVPNRNHGIKSVIKCQATWKSLLMPNRIFSFHTICTPHRRRARNDRECRTTWGYVVLFCCQQFLFLVPL